MAQLHNGLPVMGVVITDGSQPMFNNQKVLGVREAAPGALFEANHVVRGAQEITDGARIWNDQPVIGVFVIADGRTIWNDQPVIPVDGLNQVQDAFQRVVIIGASLEAAMYGTNLTTPNQWATQSLNNGLPVYGYATSGVRTRALITNVNEAVAAFPVVGETLFLIHPTGNDVTGNLEYSQRSAAELNALRTDLNDFLDAFGAHLPNVMPILSSFRSYWGRGYAQREIFNAQMKGSKPFNDDVFQPIYRARLSSRRMYSDGADPMQFYDWVRNDFETILQADGVHMTGTGAEQTRAEQMRRLRLWMAGTPAAKIVPVPVDNPAPAVYTAAAISPTAGLVGTVFSLTPAVFAGSEPMTVTGALTLDGDDVTAEISGGQYTATATGALAYRSTGTNAAGSAFSDATATVSAAASDAPIYVNLLGAELSLPGLNTVNITPANGGPGVGPVALVDGAGAATTATYQLSRVGGGNLTANAIQPVTYTTGTALWNGTTIYATEVLDDVWYLPAGQDALHTLRGLRPGGNYLMNFVASRQGSAGRITTFTQGSAVASVNPNADPPENISVVFTADGSGVIEFVQSCNIQFSYCCGFSLQYQP